MKHEMRVVSYDDKWSMPLNGSDLSWPLLRIDAKQLFNGRSVTKFPMVNGLAE
jgi:hypothetical protein